MSLTEPHNEFLELCAVSTSGQLTEEEQKKLQEHLAVCESCREALRQYETVAGEVIPTIAVSETSECLEPGLDWSEERAEKAFFERQEARHPHKFKAPNDIPATPHRLPKFSSESTWRHVWMLYAAGILLFLSVGFYAYREGIDRGTDIAKLVAPRPSTQNQSTLATQSSDAGHERQIARTQIEQRDKTIADLQQQSAAKTVNAFQAWGWGGQINKRRLTSAFSMRITPPRNAGS